MSTLDNPNVSNDSASVWPTILRYGLIGGLVFIVYSLIGNLTGMTSPGAGFGILAVNLLISLGIYVGIMVVAIRSFRNQENGGFISFGKAFGIGLGAAVIAGILSSAFTYIYVTAIDPSFFDTMIEDTALMYERLGMSEEQIEQAMAQVKKIYTPVGIVRQALIFNVIMGAIVAAIVGAIMKRSPETA
jgi:hypothetical protein